MVVGAWAWWGGGSPLPSALGQSRCLFTCWCVCPSLGKHAGTRSGCCCLPRGGQVALVSVLHAALLSACTVLESAPLTGARRPLELSLAYGVDAFFSLVPTGT